MEWTVASAVDIFSETKKKNTKIPGEIPSVCLRSSVLPFYLDKFYCFGSEMKEHRTGILFNLVLCKAFGIDISFYVKSIRQW